MAYRSAVQSSTGRTPYFMLFGREIKMPVVIMFQPSKAEHMQSDYPN